MRKTFQRWPRFRLALYSDRLKSPCPLLDEECRRLARLLGHRSAAPLRQIRVNGVARRGSVNELIAELRATVEANRDLQKFTGAQPASFATDRRMLAKLTQQLDRFIKRGKDSTLLRTRLEPFAFNPDRNVSKVPALTLQAMDFAPDASTLLTLLKAPQEGRKADALWFARHFRKRIEERLPLFKSGARRPALTGLAAIRIRLIWHVYASDEYREDRRKLCAFAEYVFSLCDLPAPRMKDYGAWYEELLFGQPAPPKN